MANENITPVKPAPGKPADKKACCSSMWCCHLDGQHWFIKLFFAAAVAGLILVLGIMLVRADMLNQGNDRWGCGCAKRDAGCNLAFGFKSAGGTCTGEAGGCPMAQGLIASEPAFNVAVPAPTTGAFIASGDVLVNPNEIKDLAAVFTVSGEVTAVTESQLSVTDSAQTVKTVNVNAATKVKTATADGTLGEIKVGDRIAAVVLPGVDDNLNAQLIRILAE